METEWDWKLQSDWYSPTRLHDSPIEYDFPGDRFIPNRSLMNLDQAHTLLTNPVAGKQRRSSSFSSTLQKLEKNLKLDVEGRSFKMLVFRGSPKLSRKTKTDRFIDETRRSDEEMYSYKPVRRFPKSESRILDAPGILNDYYLNVMDWGKTNILAIGLGTKLYLWNATNRKTELLSEELVSEGNYPSSVSWSQDGKTMAAGYECSRIELYDAETLKTVRCLNGHTRRVGSMAWNGHILTSGSRDRAIINHDVRARNSVTSCTKVHTGEVCGLKWSETGNLLASGGNDNLLYIWDVSKTSSVNQLHKFNDHCASVKALAWCPYKSSVLASGGGTDDGSIKLWDIQKGSCIKSVDTKSQICGLQWNRHHKELLSGHGYSTTESSNKICLWKYPSMSKIDESKYLNSRVLHLSQSPDGVTVASAGADETLRFWDVFGPVNEDSTKVSYLDSLLSLKTTPIR